jgi:hypothetical protein
MIQILLVFEEILESYVEVGAREIRQQESRGLSNNF